MLKRKQTLSKEEITLVAKKGKYIGQNGYLAIKFLPQKTGLKFAISIAKKVEKLAVKRNLVKRRLRIALHTLLKEDDSNINEGWFLIVVKNELPRASAATLANDLRQIVQKHD